MTYLRLIANLITSTSLLSILQLFFLRVYYYFDVIKNNNQDDLGLGFSSWLILIMLIPVNIIIATIITYKLSNRSKK